MLQVAAGTLSIPGSTGNQSITGLGFKPVAILFVVDDIGTPPAFALGAKIGIGAAASSGGVSEASMGFASINGVNPSDSVAYIENTACISLIHCNAGPAAVDAQASLSSFDADGFTLNWSAVSTGTVGWIAFGGSDVANAKVVEYTVPAATGSQTITGAGFTPTLALFGLCRATANNDTTNGNSGRIGMGVAVDSAARWAVSVIQDSGGGTGEPSFCRSEVETTDCVLESASGGTAAAADFTAFTSDGCTINWSAVKSGTMGFVLFLGGTFKAAVKQVTQPTSTGNQSYTGVGFKPVCELFSGVNITAVGNIADGQYFLGAAVDSTHRWVMAVAANTAMVAGVSQVCELCQNAACVQLQKDDDSATEMEADLVSQDADGFTLNWNHADATQRLVEVLALGSSGSVPERTLMGVGL